MPQTREEGCGGILGPVVFVLAVVVVVVVLEELLVGRNGPRQNKPYRPKQMRISQSEDSWRLGRGSQRWLSS